MHTIHALIAVGLLQQESTKLGKMGSLILDKELESQGYESSPAEKIGHKIRQDLGHVIQDTKLDTIKKLERKRLDYEIIKDNA